MPPQSQREFVLYLRKSKGRAGIARQRRVTTRHIESIDGKVIAEFVDADTTAYAKPGRRTARDGWSRMLDMLRADEREIPLGVGALHPDRLDRSTADADELIAIAAEGRHPVETAWAGRYELWTPMGRKRFKHDAVDAEYEVDHMVERIEAAKQEAASEGRWLGGRRPFGFTGDGETHHPVEGPLVDAASTAVLTGGSLTRITRDWRDAGISGTSGGEFVTTQQVRRILLRPRNAGIMVHRGREVGLARWLPLLLAGEYAPRWQAAAGDERQAVEAEWRQRAEERFRAVVAVLTDPARRTSPPAGRRWLGSGLYRCGLCGLPLRSGTAGNGVNKDGTGRGTHPAYRCSGWARHVIRDARALDAYVAEVIVARLRRPDAAGLLADPGEDTAPLRAELAAARDRKTELGSLYADGAIDADQLREGTAKLREQIARLEDRIAAGAQTSALSGLADAEDPAVWWQGLDLDRRRSVVDLLLEVTVLPAPRGRPPGWVPGTPYFNPSAVRLEWKV